ncbi:MAG TPA: hypothetical protein VF605_12550 [Allosphingosinicella sp.]|jgi:hypothetical protein
MTDSPDSPEPPPDPEVDALLDFPPVVRKCIRQDGWTAERQREFIRALVVLGHAEQAAIAVEGTMSGAYKLRKAEGGERFAASWDSALALHLRRYPKPEPRGRPSRGEIRSGVGRQPWPSAAAAHAPEPVDPEEEARKSERFWVDMLNRYAGKLKEERAARLEGRIVEADYTVRQLTWLEIVFDIGGQAMRILNLLRRDDRDLLQFAATPMAELLGSIRRDIWAEKGEADRPPPPPLGPQRRGCAIDEPLHYRRDRDGDFDDWRLRQDEQARLAAEAQQAWEERARADSEAWAKREAGGDGEAPGDGGDGEGEGKEP